MLEHEVQEKLKPVVLVGQIIVAALIAGVVFLTIMLVIVFNTERADKDVEADEPMVAYVGAGLAAMATIGRLTIGPFLARSVGGGGQGPAGNLDVDDPVIKQAAGGWLTSTIVRNSFTEGAALVNAIAYMVHGQIWSIAIVGGLLAWMAAAFPRMSQLEEFVQDRQMEADLDGR